jgi:hypothetical protein
MPFHEGGGNPVGSDLQFDDRQFLYVLLESINEMRS